MNIDRDFERGIFFVGIEKFSRKREAEEGMVEFLSKSSSVKP